MLSRGGQRSAPRERTGRSWTGWISRSASGPGGAGKIAGKLLLGLFREHAGQVVRGGADTREMVKSEVPNTSACSRTIERYQMACATT